MSGHGRRVGWVALSGLMSAVVLVVPARPGWSEELDHWRVVIAAVPIRFPSSSTGAETP